jgi:predicted DNA-binding transcriptional regulator AlpA
MNSPDLDRLDRRVPAAELAALLGFTPEWLRRLERMGRIPKARRDPGSRRKWWPLSEVQSIVAGRATDTQTPAE